jgi:hypothetical protein
MPADPVVFALMIAREFIDPDTAPVRMTNREVVELINIALRYRSVTEGEENPLK